MFKFFYWGIWFIVGISSAACSYSSLNAIDGELNDIAGYRASLATVYDPRNQSGSDPWSRQAASKLLCEQIDSKMHRLKNYTTAEQAFYVAEKIKSHDFFVLSADKGYAPAQYYLGEVYSDPKLGMSSDLGLSTKYFQMAAKQNYRDAKQKAKSVETLHVTNQQEIARKKAEEEAKTAAEKRAEEIRLIEQRKREESERERREAEAQQKASAEVTRRLKIDQERALEIERLRREEADRKAREAEAPRSRGSWVWRWISGNSAGVVERPLPVIAGGYEDVYRRFINGRLVYNGISGKRKFLIADVVNRDTLNGEFNLRGLSYNLDGKMCPIDECISIKVGYRKAVESETRVTVWLTPRFLIDQSSSAFKYVRWSSDVGIFWTHGRDDVDSFDYVTTKQFDEISTTNLRDFYRGLSRDGRMHQLESAGEFAAHYVVSKVRHRSADSGGTHRWSEVVWRSRRVEDFTVFKAGGMADIESVTRANPNDYLSLFLVKF